MNQSQTPNVVLAVDPGRAKCGVAAVAQDGGILSRSIVSAPDLPVVISSLAARFDPAAIVVGDGTGTRAICELISGTGLAAPVVLVDERHTSEAARARYVAETPARG